MLPPPPRLFPPELMMRLSTRASRPTFEGCWTQGGLRLPVSALAGFIHPKSSTAPSYARVQGVDERISNLVTLF